MIFDMMFWVGCGWRFWDIWRGLDTWMFVERISHVGEKERDILEYGNGMN